jgi:hypothetical protein
MKLRQSIYHADQGQTITESEGFSASAAQLVLAFGERSLLDDPGRYNQLREQYPTAAIVVNSTSGEIYDDKVSDNSIVLTAIEFEKTTVRSVQINIKAHHESYAAGKQLAQALDDDDLAAIFIISDGSVVNGSKLIDALNTCLNRIVPITGGLAGDAARFERTLVGLNQPPSVGKIVGIGLYGKQLTVGTSSMGGWDVFGPEREVTRSEYNVLYQIGEKQALDLYQEYLGKYAEGLPSAALFFPLSMRTTPDSHPLVRTILSIDETDRSMTFAGDMPEKSLVRFMTANLDRLIEAAAVAAHTAIKHVAVEPELVILVSCVGRKLVLGQRVDEEVEAVRDVFGPKPVLTGFYSYGEISPIAPDARCELHNQTMTITVFSEK